jgi:hypothetical protein
VKRNPGKTCLAVAAGVLTVGVVIPLAAVFGSRAAHHGKKSIADSKPSPSPSPSPTPAPLPSPTPRKINSDDILGSNPQLNVEVFSFNENSGGSGAYLAAESALFNNDKDPGGIRKFFADGPNGEANALLAEPVSGSDRTPARTTIKLNQTRLREIKADNCGQDPEISYEQNCIGQQSLDLARAQRLQNRAAAAGKPQSLEQSYEVAPEKRTP